MLNSLTCEDETLFHPHNPVLGNGKKCIVIGAGPAGLTAAYELLKLNSGYEVIVLESSSEIGGISRTVKYHGNRMDIGGHRFFSKDPRVKAIWNELMPQQGAPSFDDLRLGRNVPLCANGPDPEKEDLVMLVRNRVSRIYYKNKFFDYPVKMNFKTICNMGVWTTFIAGMSYLATLFHKLPEDNLENFYINRFGKKLYTMFFEGYTEKLWGRHPREISAEWGAQRVKGLSILAILKDILSKIVPHSKRRHVETSLIEEFNYPKFGPGQLWETMADRICEMGGKISLNCEVKRFTVENNEIKNICVVENGEEVFYDADIFISSMPLKELAAGLPDVPESVKEVAAGLPYRDFVTIGFLVNALEVKNLTKLKTLNDIIPDCWIYVQDSGVKLGRVQIFNNWSPYLVADPENSVWIGLEYFCKEGDEFWNTDDAGLKKTGFEELVKIGLLSARSTVLDFHIEKVPKAYPAYFDTYQNINKLIAHLNSIKNLYCTGRNGQHRYNNMDHSMVTSIETVNNIVNNGCLDKTAIWEVNTEKEYHEENKHD